MRRAAAEDFAALLSDLPARAMRRRLVRCVPQLSFSRGNPPSYLFASGRRNRCNPEGVRCLYFSEDERTADAEYRQAWRGLPAEHQPKLTFFAWVRLQGVLDLANPVVATALGLGDDDYVGAWRLSPSATPLQKLGSALSRQHRIAALRFPSAACRALRRKGWNLAIYIEALSPANRVEILGPSEEPLEVL